ncbi:MAG: mechanosensitive ion channel [Verrucomicrobia bacterium]|nr:mechanosensitive ion channel [Verrucomicrobiota bacterium]
MTLGAADVQLFNRLDGWAGLKIVAIVLALWLAFVAVERGIPFLAGRLAGRFRLYLLPLIPFIRLGLLLTALGFLVPIVIRPTAQNLVAILGAAGLAIGFAFKDYASSVLAGIVAVFERPYRPGDWVTIDGAYGEVQSLGLRTVRLVTPGDTVVTIPHARLWTASVHNENDGDRALQCAAEFYLHPQHDAAVVQRRLRDVALTSVYVQLDRPIAVVCGEKPGYTVYRLKGYPIDSRDQFKFTTDLTVRGKAALAELGVAPLVLPMPQTPSA